MPRPITIPNVFGTMSGQVSASLIDQDFNTVTSAINDSSAGYVNFAIDTGSANSYVVSLTPPASSYANGFLLSFLPLNANTGPSSINVDGLGNVQILALDGSALTPQNIMPGTVYSIVCMNNAFRVISPPLSSTINIIGEVRMYTGSAAPVNWLMCDGLAYSRTQYAGLFAVMSTTYGAGDGTSTFNVPDFRGRSPLGAGQGAGLTSRAIGASLGEENHVLTGAELAAHIHGISDFGHVHGITDFGHAHGISDPGHSHNVSDPGHQHTYAGAQTTVFLTAAGAATMYRNDVALTSRVATGIGIVGNGTGITGTNASGAGIRIDPAGTGIGATVNAGSSFAHNTIHPSLVVNYIIRAL